jgi:serine/threonine-protein kinase
MPAAVKPEDEIVATFPPGQELVDESSNERYHVLELVGRGGMGEVSRALRLSDGAHCAVKCVRGDMVDNKTVALRTRFEALAFRKITHPNVVRVHGTGILWGRVPWMCMDWLEGFTLAEIIELHGKIPIRWAVEIVRDLCCGLQAIHPVAVHRDIKPSNAHFGLDAVTRALDLGAAKPKEANVHLTVRVHGVHYMSLCDHMRTNSTGRAAA